MKKLFFTFTVATMGIASFTSCKKMGCTDPSATNYDSKANNNDGACFYSDLDGNTYNVNTFGSQIFMTSDLQVTKYRNGDEIPKVSFGGWSSLTTGAWCYFMNDKSKGVLYNWYAVNDPRGLAPDGWHIPNDGEWATLSSYLGGDDFSGKKMKSKTDWLNNGNGTNESGFNGFPRGIREFENGSFCYFGVSGFWWSRTAKNSANANYRQLGYFHDKLINNNREKSDGMSVRCLKD